MALPWRRISTVILSCSIVCIGAYLLFVACAALHFYLNRSTPQEQTARSGQTVTAASSDHTCRLPSDTTGYDTSGCGPIASGVGLRAADCSLSCSSGHVGAANAVCSRTGGEFTLSGCVAALPGGCTASTTHPSALSPFSCAENVGLRVTRCTVGGAVNASCDAVAKPPSLDVGVVAKAMKVARDFMAHHAKAELDRTTVPILQSDVLVSTTLQTQRLNRNLDLENCFLEAWLPLAAPEVLSELSAVALHLTVPDDLDSIRVATAGPSVELPVSALFNATVRVHVSVPFIGSLERRISLTGNARASLAVSAAVSVSGLEIQKPSRSGLTAVTARSVSADLNAALIGTPTLGFNIPVCTPLSQFGVPLDICAPLISLLTPLIVQDIHRVATDEIQANLNTFKPDAERKVREMSYFEFDIWAVELLCLSVGCNGRTLGEMVRASSALTWVLISFTVLLVLLSSIVAWLQRQWCGRMCCSRCRTKVYVTARSQTSLSIVPKDS